MTNKDAIRILKEHNKWRRAEPPYEDDGIAKFKMPVELKELGLAIDNAILVLQEAIDKSNRHKKIKQIMRGAQ